MRGIKKIKKGMTCDPQSAIWMALTLITFPLIAIIASTMECHAFASFGFGALASIAILLIELITRRRVWFLDPCLKEWIEHPHLTFHLVGFLGITLVLFLSFLVTGFIFNASFDQNIIRFIMNRQCADPQTRWISNLCMVPEIEPENSVDPVAMAIRMKAAQSFYPNSTLVTCAQKTIKQTRDEITVTRSALVRCDQWIIGVIMKKPVSYQSTYALVMTKLLVQNDGSYQIQEWSDDSTSQEWRSIGEDIASSTLLEYQNESSIERIQQTLANETAQRALLFLSRE
jgi:hypothetical protein